MLCSQCGKEIVRKHVCPYCGTRQENDDPFVTLGDLGKDSRKAAAPKAEASERQDFFHELGDIRGKNITGHSGEAGGKAKIRTDPFQPLDGVSGTATSLDKPASGGFKPMGDVTSLNDDPLVVSGGDKSAGGGFNPVGDLDTPGGKTKWKNPLGGAHKYVFPVPIEWKKWGVAAACCAVVFIIGLVVLFASTDDNIYEKALIEKIDSEIIYGTNLPLSYQYSNAVVSAIDFQILKTDSSANTASVRFTYVDALSLADAYGGKLGNPDEYYSYCIDRITSGTAPTRTDTILVYYVDSESTEQEVLVVLDSIDLADVITGGIASEYLNLIGGGKR